MLSLKNVSLFALAFEPSTIKKSNACVGMLAVVHTHAPFKKNLQGALT